MPRPHKYRPGPAIVDPVAAAALLLADHWFYWAFDPRPKSPKVLTNMSLTVIATAARHGRLRLAIPNEE